MECTGHLSVRSDDKANLLLLPPRDREGEGGGALFPRYNGTAEIPQIAQTGNEYPRGLALRETVDQ